LVSAHRFLAVWAEAAVEPEAAEWGRTLEGAVVAAAPTVRLELLEVTPRRTQVQAEAAAAQEVTVAPREVRAQQAAMAVRGN